MKNGLCAIAAVIALATGVVLTQQNDASQTEVDRVAAGEAIGGGDGSGGLGGSEDWIWQ